MGRTFNPDKQCDDDKGNKSELHRTTEAVAIKPRFKDRKCDRLDAEIGDSADIVQRLHAGKRDTGGNGRSCHR